MSGLSINEITTYRWSFDDDIRRYRDAGIDAIGVWRQKLADFGEDKGIELLARSGLKASNVLWAGGFTGSDGHSYDESLSDARDALQLAAALHARHLVVYSGSRNGHTLKHARRLFLSALGELLPLAEQLSVVLAIEPMHCHCAGNWTFITNLDDALSIMDELDTPALRLVFDTYHLGHEPNLLERIASVVPRIGIVHLGDCKGQPDNEQNRQRLGEGTLRLPCIVRAIKQAGYDGFYDVELLGEDIEASDYDDLLECAKRAYREWVLA